MLLAKQKSSIGAKTLKKHLYIGVMRNPMKEKINGTQRYCISVLGLIDFKDKKVDQSYSLNQLLED